MAGSRAQRSDVRHRTVDQLALVATTYRIAITDGKSPVDAVADRLEISQRLAKQRIYRARRAGLLAPVTTGV